MAIGTTPPPVTGGTRPRGGIEFTHPGAFWFGIAAVTAGVFLHLPMYLGARDQGYRLVGMPMDPPMILGMFLILVGISATAYGLFPRLSEVSRDQIARFRVKALDDAPIKKSHVALLLVMAAAVTIDVMKPTSLAFVVPGMAEEYGLKSPNNPSGTIPVALLPLSGITGTVIGSFLWGWMGDRIGRRSSILLAGVIFIATAICGAMPHFVWNFVMCFVMGLGAGGMLPITFTLMAETIPARHRGWIMVLIGGDVAGAYIITSWLAAEFVPTFTWRFLWLIGFPTGIILILLNRWVPESPRFLLSRGREEEARSVMERYGATVVREEESELAVEESVRSRYGQLLRRPFLGPSTVVILLALGVGFVSYGFLQWIPSNLQAKGLSQVTADRTLRDSALIGFPLNFIVAWAYGFWSSKRTIIVLAGLTAAAMFGFVVTGDSVVTNRPLLYVLLIVPIWGISSVVAVLSAYSSEIYPTRIRSRGSGLAAGVSKFGGVIIIALVAAAVAPPSISITALLGAVPMVLATGAIVLWGLETRKRRLEEITAEELQAAVVD